MKYDVDFIEALRSARDRLSELNTPLPERNPVSAVGPFETTVEPATPALAPVPQSAFSDGGMPTFAPKLPNPAGVLQSIGAFDFLDQPSAAPAPQLSPREPALSPPYQMPREEKPVSAFDFAEPEQPPAQAPAAPPSLGILGESFGMLTPEEQKAWIVETKQDALNKIAESEKAIKDTQAYIAQHPGVNETVPSVLAEPSIYDDIIKQRKSVIEEQREKLANIEAIERGEKPPATKSGLRAGVESTVQSLGTTLIGAPVKFAGIVQGYAKNVAGSEAAPDEASIYQTGKQIDDFVRQVFPGDEARADEFGQKLSHGIGSLTAFYGTGALQTITRLGPKAFHRIAQSLPFLLGGTLSSTQHFDAATEKMKDGKPVSEADRAKATATGFALGLTEALPVTATMKAASTMKKGATAAQKVKNVGTQAAIGAAEEGAQEFGQSVASDITAREFYDPERKIGETAAEEGLIGTLLGGGARGTTTAISELRGEKKPKKDKPAPEPEPEAAPVAEEPVSTETAVEEEAAEDVFEELPDDEIATPAKPATVEKAGDLDEVAAVVDTEPSAAQKEAGNYRKATVRLTPKGLGVKVAIETPKGAERRGVDADGKEWSATTQAHYGYIKGEEGKDGDAVDIFLGPDLKSQEVTVVNQIDPKTGKLDEHKILYGFKDQEAAEKAYRGSYSDKVDRVGSIYTVPVAEFKGWLKDGDKRKEFAPAEVSTADPDPRFALTRKPAKVAPEGAPDAETTVLERSPAKSRKPSGADRSAVGEETAGRAGLSKPVGPRGELQGKDAAPAPSNEAFEVPGFRGEFKDLSPVEGGLARRRYSLYPEGSGKNAKPVATMHVRQASNGRGFVYDVEAPGSGAKLYDQVEKHFGVKLQPSGLLTESGFKFWKKRDPETVKWHQWSAEEEMYLSPRQLLERREEGSATQEIDDLWEGLPADAQIAAADGDAMFALRAFHGSPHDFDRFDISRIGTGEGAQAFGHGLYFAENELVARSYQNVLAAEGITLDGESIAGDSELMDLAITKLSGQNLEGQSLDDYEQIARSNLERVQSQPEPTEAEASRYFTTVEAMRARQAANLEAAQDYLAKVQRVKAGEVKSPGQLYEVEIDVEPEQLLDWDKPLSEQSAEIKELMRKRPDVFPDESVWPEWTGEQLYRGQAASYAGVDWARVSEKTNASKDFREAGIPGIRYLDQGSRDAGEGSRNIVLFDDSLVKITKKNGKPVSAEERQGVIDQMFALRSPTIEQQPLSIGNGKRGYRLTAEAANNREEIFAAVEAEINRMAPGVKVRFKDLPQGVEGAYVKSLTSIFVALKANDPKAIGDHEVIHAVRALNIINDAEWSTLKAAAIKNDWLEKHNVPDEYSARFNDLVQRGELTEEQALDQMYEEAVAWEFAEWRKGKRPASTAWQRLFQRLNAFINRIMRALKRQKIEAYEQVFETVEKGPEARQRDLQRERAAAQNRSDIAERIIARFAGLTVEDAEAALAAAESRFAVGDMPGKQTETAEFKRWFGDSKVVDENGEPLVVYHGSGNIENLEAFDPTFTGQGNDQLGSGFYFSTRPETASDYTTRRLTDDQQKLGGESSPGIVPVYVAMNNPIVLHGNDMISNAVDLTADQAEAIIRRAPNLYDVDETPLGNWHDVWSEGVQDHMIADVAQSYTGPTLISLENDFFRGQSTIFRQALQDVLGYDGVIQEFDTGEKHIVAWFPTQIKSAIGNRGTFDPTDPRISYALSGRRTPSSALGKAYEEFYDGYAGLEPESRRYMRNRSRSYFQRAAGAFGSQLQSIRNTWQDNFLPVRRLEEAQKREQQVDLPDDMRPYMREELYHSRLQTRIEDFEEQHVEPLKKAIAESGIDLEQLEVYLYARHAEERNKQIASINPKMQDGGSGMSTADARIVLQSVQNSGKAKDYDRIAQMVYAINDAKLDQRVAYGLMTQDEADTLRKTYKSYVPLKGDPQHDDERTPPRVNVPKGFSVTNKDMVRAMGRKSRAHDLISRSVQDYLETMVRGERNRVAQALYEMLKAHPMPDVALIDTPKMKRFIDKRTGMQTALVANAPVQTAKQFKEMVKEQADPLAFLDPNTMSVMVNGERHTIRFLKPELRDAMMNVGITQGMGLMKAAWAFNRWIAMMATSLNPSFALPNFIRDFQAAGINLMAAGHKKAFRRVAKNSVRGMKAIIAVETGGGTGQWADLYRELKRTGGTTGFYSMKDWEKQQKQLARDVRLLRAGLLNPERRANALWKGFKDVVGGFNNVFENATRLAAYKIALESGLSKEKAASIAKNITVNFNRRGRLDTPASKMVLAMYLFANPSIQGSHRLSKAFKDATPARRYGILASLVGLGAMTALYNVLIGAALGDDEEKNIYETTSDYDRANNWLFLNPFAERKEGVSGRDAVAFKIPMPYGYGAIVNLGRLLMEHAIYQNTDLLKEERTAGKTFGEIVSIAHGHFDPLGAHPNPLAAFSPTIAKPFVEMYTNTKFHGGPVYPMSFDPSEPDTDLAFRTTPDAYKQIARWINGLGGGDEYHKGKLLGVETDFSPETLKHLWTFGIGGVGNEAARLFTMGERQYVTKEPIRLNDIPIIRRFVSDEVGWGYSNDYYAIRDEKMKPYEDVRRDAAKGSQAAKDILPNLELEKRLYAIYKKSDKLLSKYRKDIKANDKARDDGKITTEVWARQQQDIYDLRQLATMRFMVEYYAERQMLDLERDQVTAPSFKAKARSLINRRRERARYNISAIEQSIKGGDMHGKPPVTDLSKIKRLADKLREGGGLLSPIAEFVD